MRLCGDFLSVAVLRRPPENLFGRVQRTRWRCRIGRLIRRAEQAHRGPYAIRIPRTPPGTEPVRHRTAPAPAALIVSQPPEPLVKSPVIWTGNASLGRRRGLPGRPPVAAILPQ